MDQWNNLEPLFPDREGTEPLAPQLARRLRQAIQSGIYKPLTRLLPQRELAARLGLSRNTVASALEQLIAEGILETRVGSGTYVAAGIATRTRRPPEHPLPPYRAAWFTAARAIYLGPARGGGVLRAGSPDPSMFPYAAWSRVARRNLERFSDFFDYGDARGMRALREGVVRHVAQFRGVTADVDRVLIVDGTQAALRLVCDVLLSEGDHLAIEDPCYHLARAAFEARGLHLRPVAVDAQGMRVELAPPARAAYVTPSNQFPFGSRLSLERRHALLAWARRHEAYVIEDDYDSEFSFDGRPLPALQSIDRDERVIYIGSFSKTLAPGLRTGYVIVPEHLTHSFSAAWLLSTLGINHFIQATLADFLAEGHYVRHVHRMTIAYGERRRALVALLEASLPKERFTLGVTNAGLHVTVTGPPTLDDLSLARALAREGLIVQPLSAFCVERTDLRGVILGYGGAPTEEVLAAAAVVVRVIREIVSDAE